MGLEAAVLLCRAQLSLFALRARAGADRRLLLLHRVDAPQESPVGGVGEVEVAIAHREAIGQRERAIRLREDAERRLPAGKDLSAEHLLEKRGDLGSGQGRRDVHVDPLVHGAEQRHGDAAGVELPGDAAPEYGDTGEVLREILVGAPIEGGVAEARHDDELAGPRHAVDRRVPLPQLVDVQGMPGGDGKYGGFLGRGVLFRGQERDPDEGRGDYESWCGSHCVSISPAVRLDRHRFIVLRRVQNRRRSPTAVCSPPTSMSSVSPLTDGTSTIARL